MIFPDIIGSSYAFSVSFNGGSLFSGGTNRTTRLRRTLQPRYHFNLGWTNILLPSLEAIRAQVADARSGGVPFVWFSWVAMPWRYVPVGVGNGVNQTFVLPGKETSDQNFYVDGTTAVSGTVSPGVGPNGEDEVTLDSPPPAGHRVSMAFYGRRRFTVWFDDASQDDLPVLLANDLYSYSTAFTEKR